MDILHAKKRCSPLYSFSFFLGDSRERKRGSRAHVRRKKQLSECSVNVICDWAVRLDSRQVWKPAAIINARCFFVLSQPLTHRDSKVVYVRKTKMRLNHDSRINGVTWERKGTSAKYSPRVSIIIVDYTKRVSSFTCVKLAPLFRNFKKLFEFW